MQNAAVLLFNGVLYVLFYKLYLVALFYRDLLNCILQALINRSS